MHALAAQLGATTSPLSPTNACKYTYTHKHPGQHPMPLISFIPLALSPMHTHTHTQATLVLPPLYFVGRYESCKQQLVKALQPTPDVLAQVSSDPVLMAGEF